MRIKSNQDLFGGGLLIALAAITLVKSDQLPMGTIARMGPGFLPITMAVCLLGLGVALALISFFPPKEEPTAFPHWRPWLFISVAPLIFAVTIDRWGFVASIVATSVVARLGVRHPLGWDIILLPPTLALMCSILFVEILGQPIALWP